MDDLKVINDTCGHQAGDQAIQGAADMIRLRSIANSSVEDGLSYRLLHVKLPSGLKITEWLIRWIWFWIFWTSSKS